MSANPNNNENDQNVKIRIKCVNPIIVSYPRCPLCLICRHPLNEICINCRSMHIKDPSECTTVQGVCGHIFHKHCLECRLKNVHNCPYPGCDSVWYNI